MTNTTMKILKISTPKKSKKLPLVSLRVIKKCDRCVVCGLLRVLQEHEGFWYCAEYLEIKEKLETNVEYNTDFSNPNPSIKGEIYLIY